MNHQQFSKDQPAQPATQPVINMTGEKIGLGPIRRDLIPLYYRWINDFEVARTLGLWRPMSWEQEEAWYERASRSEDTAMFTIYELGAVAADGTLRPIGNVGLDDINRTERTAEFGIMIGEKDAWGKGYGTEAAKLMLDFGFNVLGLHNIYLRVFSYNDRGLHAYKKAGFKEAGRLREAHRIGGRGYDVIYMDCLSTEFESNVLRKLLPRGLHSASQVPKME